MPRCLSCQRGLVSECWNGLPEGCPNEQTISGDSNSDSEMVGEVLQDEYESDDRNESLERRTRRHKSDAALKDQQSTGRKRAAKEYPLDREADCEWRNRENCGGGSNPIKGCSDGLQQCRHHGPDYSTLNNDPDNVSRICHKCHNRWHAANDPYKSEAYLKQFGHTPKKLGKDADVLQKFLAEVKEDL